MRNLATRHYHQGTVIVTMALVMLFLLGAMGIALDFYRHFIVNDGVSNSYGQLHPGGCGRD